MNLIDAGVLALLVIGLISGARAGFLGPVLGLVGAAIGFGLALLLATVFSDQLAVIEQPMRAIVTMVGLGAFVIVGEAVGAAGGTTMSHSLWKSGLRPLDAVGGAVVGVAHVALLVWLIGGMLAAGMAPSLASAARESVALRIAGERLPPPTIVAGQLIALLDTTGLPPLFAGFEPAPAPPVALPADAESSGPGRVGDRQHRAHREHGLRRGPGGRKRLLRLADGRRHKRARGRRRRRYDRHDRWRGPSRHRGRV